MKIAVFGAGAIGCLVGSYLSKNNDVTLIGRKKLVENFNRDGIVIQGLTNQIFRNMMVSEELDGEFDLVILTVKSYDTDKAMHYIADKIKDAYLLSLQNGLDNISIIRGFRPDRLLAGVTTHGAYSIDYGKIVHTGLGITRIGTVSKDAELFLRELVRKFNECGLETQYSSDISTDIWVKGAINACINPVTGILQVKNGTLISEENLHWIFRAISRECSAILELKGINVNLLELAEEVIKNTAGNYSSMAQDLKRGSLTEIDHINKVFMDEGKQHDIALPYTSTLYYLVKYIEKIKKS
ncbi:MAG: ketopantoate reductase family protein [Thermoplasmata archaeon]